MAGRSAASAAVWMWTRGRPWCLLAWSLGLEAPFVLWPTPHFSSGELWHTFTRDPGYLSLSFVHLYFSAVLYTHTVRSTLQCVAATALSCRITLLCAMRVTQPDAAPDRSASGRHERSPAVCEWRSGFELTCPWQASSTSSRGPRRGRRRSSRMSTGCTSCAGAASAGRACP